MKLKTIKPKYYCLIKIILIIFMLITLFAISWDCWISWKTHNYIYQDINKLPERAVGVVLGTAKFYRKNVINAYYQSRIETAAKLYQQQKIKYLLLSGDNATIYYNEPAKMREDLIAAGVNKNATILDNRGMRTFDSIIRMKQVFAINHFIIITQKFHCERALFIALHHNIDAYCYPAPLVKVVFWMRLKNRLRETLARSKTLLDLYVLPKELKSFES